MKAFNKKFTEKISKLPIEQIENIVESLSSENDAMFSILNSLNTGLLICDENFKLIKKNKAASRFLPLKKWTNEAKNSDLDYVWNLIEDEDINSFIKKCATERKLNANQDFSVTTMEDRVRIISVAIQSLVQNQHFAGFIIRVDDVTEIRSQEVLMRRMENLTSLTSLAASVAHEIKNPLGSISIHIQLIQKAIAKAREKDGLIPDEKFVERYLGIVTEEIDRLNKIIVDFLFAVRPISMEIETVNLTRQLENFIEFIKPEIEKKKIKLEVNLEKNIPDLLLDSKLLKQVLINLAQNSIAATDEGGIINIKTLLKNDTVLICFADSGIGMDKETQNRIFEPYYTTKVTGTGLGLTMVYKIIKEFGGNIDVKSEVGKGSIFTISLPIPQKETRLLDDKTKSKE